MRTVTKQYDVFPFRELSEDSKQKALEKYYDINVDYECWDFLYDDAQQVGLKIEGFDLGRAQDIDMKFTDEPYEVACKIVENHGEQCGTVGTAKAFILAHDEIIEQAERDENGDFVDEYAVDQQLDEAEREFLSMIKQDYFSLLNQEYEYRTSEAAIIETFEANEYEFTADGAIF